MCGCAATLGGIHTLSMLELTCWQTCDRMKSMLQTVYRATPCSVLCNVCLRCQSMMPILLLSCMQAKRLPMSRVAGPRMWTALRQSIQYGKQHSVRRLPVPQPLCMHTHARMHAYAC